MRRLMGCLAVMMLSVMPAKAELFDYVQLWGGVTLEPDLGWGGGEYSMSDGFHAGGQMGWEVIPQVRAGLDMMYTEADYDGYDTSLSSFSIMAAGTYYFDLGQGHFHPYVGAGLGVVQVNYISSSPDGGSSWAFGTEFMAGAAIPTRFNFDITLGYRYQWADDVEIEGVQGIESESHNLSAGFLFRL